MAEDRRQDLPGEERPVNDGPEERRRNSGRRSLFYAALIVLACALTAAVLASIRMRVMPGIEKAIGQKTRELQKQAVEEIKKQALEEMKKSKEKKQSKKGK